MNLTGATDKSTIMVEDFNPHLSVIESIYFLRVYIEIYKKLTICWTIRPVSTKF